MRSFENGQLGIARRLDERQTELQGKRFGDIALRNNAQRHEQGAELFARTLLQTQRAIQSRGIELAAFDQYFADALSYQCVHVFGA